MTSVAERRDLFRAEAEVGEAHDLALVHRNPAENLREIFAEAHPGEQLLGHAEAALFAHARRIGRHFLDRLDIGRKPREPVSGVLLGFDQGGAELAVLAHPFAHRGQRAIQKPLDGELGLAGEVVERHRASLLQCCAAACVGAPLVAMRHLAAVGPKFAGLRRRSSSRSAFEISVDAFLQRPAFWTDVSASMAPTFRDRMTASPITRQEYRPRACFAVSVPQLAGLEE